MAVDEAIADHAGRGEAPPTVRFYRWQPPCVSLGRHQPVSDIDLRRCRAMGYEVVRRPTGGRAILHVDELTYAVAGPQSNPVLTGAVLDSYLRLSQGLLMGLARLGLVVAKTPAGQRAGPEASALCFEVPSAYEIVAGGRKLVGSAQSRRQGWVLQHGTLPLTGDVTRLVEVLALTDEASRAALRAGLAARAVTVAEVAGRGISFAEAAEALRLGFEEALGIRLVPGCLTPAEQATTEMLRVEKYADPGWLGRF